jgi:anti-sigma factor RsiW
MRCKCVTRRLDAYATGEVSARDRARIEAHLDGCVSCQRALADLERLADLLGGTETSPVPEGLAERVMALARTRAASPARADSLWNLAAWRQALSVPVRAAAAVVLVLGLGLGILMGRGIWQGPAPSTAANDSASDPLAAYNLDYLTDAPSGSLAESYLSLTSIENPRGD